MISPIAGYTVGGIIWDQGEQNTDYCTTHQYNCLFANMIKSWREIFRQPEAPVAFVQLGPYCGNSGVTGCSDLNVTKIRFAQTDSLPLGANSYRSDGGINLCILLHKNLIYIYNSRGIWE